MAENIGAARISLEVDATTFRAQVEAARNVVASLGPAAEAAFSKADAGGKRATTSLARYAQTLGMTAEEQKLFYAAMRGAPSEAIEAAANAMRGHRDATAAATVEAKRLADEEAKRAAAASADAKRISDGQAYIKSLQQQQQAIGKSRVDLLELKAAEMGVAKEAAPMIASLRAQEKALMAASGTTKLATKEFNQYGLSVKQEVAAMRQVPAQLTDIFVSLQGGQRPMTVLIQQGGQLKDVFGGIVPAAKALGTQLMSMVNIYSVTAAAIAAVGYTYFAAESRQRAFTDALIFTGRASKDTVDDLREMAQRLDEVGGVTANSASAAIVEIVRNGKIAAGQYELVAEAALRMKVVSGTAIADTVAEYADLARSPVEAVLKLNEAENFLTQAIFQRIRTLEESGDIEGAAALASETRAREQIRRSDEAIASLGLVAGAWHTVSSNTGEAWDAAVNYFDQLDRDAKDATNTLTRLWTALKAPGGATPWALQAAMAPQPDGEDTAAIAARAAVREREEKARTEWRKEGQRYLTEEVRLEQQIAEMQARGRAAGLDELTILQRKQQMEAKFAADQAKKAGRKKGDGGLSNAESSATIAAIRSQLAEEQAAIRGSTQILQAEQAARLVSTQDYYARMRELSERSVAVEADAIREQISYLSQRNVTGKDAVNVTKQITDLEAKLAAVLAEGATKRAVLNVQEADALKRRELARVAYKESLDLETAATADSVNAAIARIGMGQKEAEQQEKIAAILETAAERRRELARAFAENNDQDAYDRDLAALQEATDAKVEVVRDGFKRMDDAQANWLNGVSAGIANWMDEQKNVAGAVESITKKTMDSAAQAITDYATTGKVQIKELLVAILKEIMSFMAKQAVLQFAQMFMGGAMGAGASGKQMTNTGGASPKNFALGGALDGSHGLSAYSGSVVNQPTPFYFAKGAGVMGEAGMEGIFPLKRGPDGKLGVSAMGGGSDQVVNVSIYNAPAGAEVQKSRGQNGELDIKVLFKEIEKGIAGNVAMGASPINSAVEGRYGMKAAV